MGFRGAEKKGQVISLHFAKCTAQSTGLPQILHEMMHTAGLVHENDQEGKLEVEANLKEAKKNSIVCN